MGQQALRPYVNFHRFLDLRWRKLDGVLRCAGTRVEALAVARDRGVPGHSATRADIGFAEVYVFQAGADLRRGTVTLVSEQGGWRDFVVLPVRQVDGWHRTVTPLEEVAEMLDGVRRDYPHTGSTAELAEVVGRVLELLVAARRNRRSTIEAPQLERVLATGLAGIAARWADGGPPADACDFLDLGRAAAGGVLYVVGGRADAIEIAVERGLEAVPVRALDARGFWHWVLQLGGDRREGSVTLAGVEPGTQVAVEPLRAERLGSHRLREAADALAAIEADYAPRQFAALAATALRNVLWLLPEARRRARMEIDARDLDRVLADELMWALAARVRESGGGFCPLHGRSTCEPCRFG